MPHAKMPNALEPTASDDRRAIVQAFLRRALADGALRVAELERQARAASLLREGQAITHVKVFKRVKAQLGIRSIRNGFGRGGDWVWTMPAPIAQVPEHSQPELPVIYGESPSDVRPEPLRETRAAVAAVGIFSTDDSPSQVSDAWLIGLARLDYHRPPTDVPVLRWRQFINDCSAFLDASAPWARRAADLGWDAVALFGCSRSQPLGHLGMAGLLWAINGGRLARLHADWAEIERAGGERRAYHRRRIDPARVTLPWRLR